MLVVDSKCQLSGGEKRILEQITKGLTNKELASCLGVSVSTIKQRLRFLYLKLGVSNRTQLALYASRMRVARRRSKKGGAPSESIV
jgi:DNA-binding NarL/FixJ family response regulator